MDTDRQIRAGRHPKFYRSRPNLYLRLIVRYRVRTYRNQNRPGRSPILLEVLEHLQKQGFTFWKQAKGEWVLMTEVEAIRKIGHTFRDAKGNPGADGPLPLFDSGSTSPPVDREPAYMTPLLLDDTTPNDDVTLIDDEENSVSTLPPAVEEPIDSEPPDAPDDTIPIDDAWFLEDLPDLDVLLLNEMQLAQSPAWDLDPIPF